MQTQSLRMQRNPDGTVSLSGAHFVPATTAAPKAVVAPSPETVMRVLPGVFRGVVVDAERSRRETG